MSPIPMPAAIDVNISPAVDRVWCSIHRHSRTAMAAMQNVVDDSRYFILLFLCYIPAMKTSKLLVIITAVALGAYILSVWTGFDERLATYASSHEKTFRKAAERGDAEAQYNLALMHDRGIGVEKNAAEALKWYRKAAEQGYAKAQYNLGMMYYFGRGVPEDKVAAYQWILLAADQGEKIAGNAVKELAKKLSSEQISSAKAAAQVWSQSHKGQAHSK